MENMEIQIQALSGKFVIISPINLTTLHLSGTFTVSVGLSDTILDLKKKIDEEEGLEPERQALYYKGYLINDDTVSVGDLTQLGGEGGNTLLLESS